MDNFQSSLRDWFALQTYPGLRPDYMTASAPSTQVDWLLLNDQELGRRSRA
jgi:hypothetical protein